MMNSKDRVEAYLRSAPFTDRDRQQIIIGWKLAQDDGERMLSPAAIEQWKEYNLKGARALTQPRWEVPKTSKEGQ